MIPTRDPKFGNGEQAAGCDEEPMLVYFCRTNGKAQEFEQHKRELIALIVQDFLENDGDLCRDEKKPG
ncbi:MAG: hypothetical protein ACLRVT_08995 [Oscillospiraceae bacterium]